MYEHGHAGFFNNCFLYFRASGETRFGDFSAFILFYLEELTLTGRKRRGLGSGTASNGHQTQDAVKAPTQTSEGRKRPGGKAGRRKHRLQISNC